MRSLPFLLSVWALALGLEGCSANTYTPPIGNPPPGPISVSITDKFSSVVDGSPGVTLTATVSNDSAKAGVIWTLTAGGVNCSPACGVLTPGQAPGLTANYTPPVTPPAPPNNMPTITATSVLDSSKSDTFSFSLSFSNGPLLGKYVFLLRGFGGGGQPLAIAGIADLDNKGNVTGGELDVNVAGAVTTSSAPLTGSYAVDTSFKGSTRATINISNFTLPGTSSMLALKWALSADGKRGKAIEFDGSGFLAGGTVFQQDAAFAGGTIPAGSFAFGLDSDSAAGLRVVEAGQLVLAASGVTGGVADLSMAGKPSPIYVGAPILPGSANATDANGRGTLNLTISGNAAQYAYYVVDAGHLQLIETDNGQLFGTVQAGSARLQNNLSGASVVQNSVLQMTGVDRSVVTQELAPAVFIGVVSVAAGGAFSLTFDANDAGTVLVTHNASGNVATFDPATGRGVIGLPNGANGGFLDSAVFYLYDAGTGFIIDADPTAQQVKNKAYSGTLVRRGSSSFSSSSLSSNLVSLTGSSAIPAIPEIVLAANFDPVAGSFSAIADVASLPSQAGNTGDRSFSDAFQITDTTLGHGSLTLPAGFVADFSLNQPVPATFYLVDNNQFVLIGTLSGAYSGVTFFDPQ